MLIPLPFSHALFLYGEPIVVPRGDDVEEWRVRVEQALNAVVEDAEKLIQNYEG